MNFYFYKSWGAMALALIFCFSACKKEEQHELSSHIPADAAMIVAFNVNSLKSKVDVKTLQDNPVFRELMSDISENEVSNFLLEEDVTGIDFSQHLYLVKQEEQAQKPLLLFSIDDKSQFKNFLADIIPDMKINDLDGIKYVFHEGNLIAWKYNIGMITSNLDGEETISNLYELSDEQKMERVSYDEFIQASFDVGIWLDANRLKQLSTKHPPAPDKKDGSLFDGDHYLLLNFEPGKLTGNHKMFGSEALMEKLQNATKDDYEGSIISHLPNDNITAFLSGNLDMKGVSDFVEWGTLEQGMKNTSMDTRDREELLALLKDVKENLNGEFIISLHGLSANKTSSGSGIMGALPSPQLFAAFSVSGDDSLLAMLDNWNRQLKGELVLEEGYYRSTVDENLFIVPKEDMLFIVSESGFRDQLINGATGRTRLPEETADMISSHPISFHLDVTRLVKAIQSTDSDLGMAAGILGQFESVQAYNTEITDSYFANDLVINFTDKDKNSLETLLNMLGIFMMFMTLG